jgi:hypothetical protein
MRTNRKQLTGGRGTGEASARRHRRPQLVETLEGRVLLSAGTGRAAYAPPGSGLVAGGGTVSALNHAAVTSTASLTQPTTPPVVVHKLPELESVTVGDGTEQRSQVKQVSLTFYEPVTPDPGALILYRHVTDASGKLTGTDLNISGVLNAPTPSNGGATWTWTFVAQEAGPDTQANGSLTDGVYSVRLDHTKAHAVSTGAELQTDYTSLRFHRLFGDINNTRNVNAADYNQFRYAFSNTAGQAGYIAGFDFNDDGRINAYDFNQFRNHFGKSLTYIA